MRLYNISFNKIRFGFKDISKKKCNLKKNKATFIDHWGQTSLDKKYASL